jgi:hypothetical protein
MLSGSADPDGFLKNKREILFCTIFPRTKTPVCNRQDPVATFSWLNDTYDAQLHLDVAVDAANGSLSKATTDAATSIDLLESEIRNSRFLPLDIG